MKIQRTDKSSIPALYDLIQDTRSQYPIQIMIILLPLSIFRKYHTIESILQDFENGYMVSVIADDTIVGTSTLLGTNVRRESL